MRLKNSFVTSTKNVPRFTIDSGISSNPDVSCIAPRSDVCVRTSVFSQKNPSPSQRQSLKHFSGASRESTSGRKQHTRCFHRLSSHHSLNSQYHHYHHILTLEIKWHLYCTNCCDDVCSDTCEMFDLFMEHFEKLLLVCVLIGRKRR